MSCILLSRAIGGVFVDVVLTEEHVSEMEIADHPIEQGSKVSDHAWLLPYRVTLESVIASDRAVPSYQALLSLQGKAEPFALITGLKVYSNMLVKEITATRDREHARVLKFTAELQEVIIVDTQASGATGDTDDDKAKGTTKRGQVSARTSTPPAKTSSVLSDAVQ
jgi:hypothetical protein